MKTIILNKMYSGNYLETDGNIGHEVINLFKSDNGKNYIYLLSDGVMPAERNGTIDAILLVRWIRLGVYEILAKAERLIQVAEYEKSREALHIKQEAYLKREKITYGGVGLTDIFKDNYYAKTKDKDLSLQVFISFETKKLRKPKRALYLYSYEAKGIDKDEEERFYLGDINLAKQSPRMYFDDKKAAARDKLQELINDESLWEPENTTDVITPEEHLYASNGGFLEIIRKEHDELVFSNLLKYYFTANEQVFMKFCKDVLGVEIGTNYTVLREHENIDLFVYDDNSAIIIENKIKSGINGERHDISSDIVQNQLHKYYRIIRGSENHKNKEIKCFLFAPNYNQISKESLNIVVDDTAVVYELVTYRKLYEFFSEHKAVFMDKYFDDFLKGLAKHSQEVDNQLFEEMRRRFSASIMRHKNHNT